MADIINFNTRVADKIKLEFSISPGDPGRVNNVEWTWKRLRERLAEPYKDELTLPQFQALSKDEQLKRKNNGYFVGGQFNGGIRRGIFMRERCLLVFDIDVGTPELLTQLQMGDTGLGDVEYVVYSTRQHTAASPRIRLVLLLARPISLDKFEPVSRVLAQKLDPSMVMVDVISFRKTQFMYWPSVCAGETFLYHHNKGTVIDPDATLKEFGPWQNYNLLPRSPRESEMHKPMDRKNDPRLKQNIVGAFCQAYNIHETIAKFLPDIYTPSEYGPDGTPTRYTYKPGTTTNGAVVYDDAMSLTSHHGTDPAGGSTKAVNPFDLRRIHEFGHLDNSMEPSDPREMASYKAMVAELATDENVTRALRNMRYGDDELEALADDSFEADEETTTPDPALDDVRDWREQLDVTAETGQVKSTLDNIVLILQNDARWFKGRFVYDEFLCEAVIAKPIIHKKLGVRIGGQTAADPFGRITDSDLAAIRLILEAPPKKRKGWGLKVHQRDLLEALAVVSAGNRVHPVREYLDGLVWDGVPRVERFWSAYYHTPDTAYYRETARCTLVACVARVFEPGCKFDFACIIEGPQGLLKSTSLAALGGYRWTGESEGHFDDQKQLVESTLGFWLVEIPELVQFSRTEVQAIKAALSRRSDHVRLAFKHQAETYWRQCVFFGTTNERNYLKDRTGNRRFWPIPCGPGQIDAEGIARDRDQIWAEARHTHKEMRKLLPVGNLPLYLRDPEAAEFALTIQGERIVEDAATDNATLVQLWLDTPVPKGTEDMDADDDAGSGFDDLDLPLVPRTVACGTQIWIKVFKGTREDYGQRGGSMIRNAMRNVTGWIASASIRSKLYGRQRTYRRAPGGYSGNSDDL